MRRSAATALAVVCVLGQPAAALGKTVRLDWKERAPDKGPVVMTLRVGTLDVHAKTWGVTAAFTNRTRVRLRIVRRFALGLYRTRSQHLPTRVLSAIAYKPAPPAVLEPGQTWSGAFGGAAAIPNGVYIRVIFGVFVGKVPRPLGPEIAWVTDHAYLYSSVPAL